MSACTTSIEARFANSTAFDLWKGNQSTTMNALASLTAEPTPTQQADLLTAEQDVFNTMTCIQEKLIELNTTPAAIQEAQTTILEIQTELGEKEEQLAIAKDRVGYIQDPDAHPSYYQGWFSLDRPLKPISVPIFLGIIIFFTVFIFLGLLSLLGLNLTMTIPLLSTTSSSKWNLIDWVRRQMTITSLALVIALVATVIYFRGRK